jgi:hypothetical protein
MGVYEDTADKIKRIRKLVEDGILGEEMCPDPRYWHWPILKPELEHQIPQDIARYEGEVRLYWS